MKILMGIITNMIAYIPVIFLIEFFKKTSNRKSKSEKLQNLIKSFSVTKVNDLNYKSESKPAKNSKFILFPWFFKLILYFISYVCMALSICLVIYKGKNVILL